MPDAHSPEFIPQLVSRSPSVKGKAVAVKVVDAATLPTISSAAGGIDWAWPFEQNPITAATAKLPGITFTSREAPGAMGLAQLATGVPFTTTETMPYWLLLT